MGRDSPPFDPRHFPVLGEAGRQMLARLTSHPFAPRYRNRSGHRLDARVLAATRHDFERIVAATLPDDPHQVPKWLATHAARCHAQVPHFRERGSATAKWVDLPFTTRADLSRDIARFVPDDLPLDGLICFTTTGTTGHPLKLPSHPGVAALHFAHHRRALRRFGIEPAAGPGEVAIVLAGFQQRCFTYVSVDPLRGECGIAKINLQPGEWRDPADRARYLDALQPELISGDPVSLVELARLGMRHRPRALLSTSMALTPALRETLQEAFAAPLLDLYSMNEAGPIGVFDPRAGGFALLQPHLFVEIIDPEGRVLPAGERGEIVLSGGFNPWLPLLRYRTGDQAALVRSATGPVLRDLQGRPPVRFRTAHGAWINNIEVTHALKHLALTRHALHQSADGALILQVDAAPALARQAAAALQSLFGATASLRWQPLAADDKVVQYTSEITTDPLAP